MWSEPGRKEKQRFEMINGKALKMLKCIKNPSAQEVMLRDIILELYPNADPQHQVFNYSIDIALIEYKIAIEFDGWYHFDCEQSIERHKKRQKKIEDKGWKFIRYNIFHKFQ
jgi:very-short-patch-repair endonuclease